jgi:flagellar secretion chaperone FliS
MDQSLNSHYLESKVLTAPAYRLHLMLIEGAIRFGRQAAGALDRGDRLAASAPLLRMLDIVGELLAGVRESKTELSQKLAEVYLYLFQDVSLAKINNDPAKLSEALKLLDFERETWQLVSDKMEGTDPAKSNSPIAHHFGSPLSPATSFGLMLEA